MISQNNLSRFSSSLFESFSDNATIEASNNFVNNASDYSARWRRSQTLFSLTGLGEKWARVFLRGNPGNNVVKLFFGVLH